MFVHARLAGGSPTGPDTAGHDAGASLGGPDSRCTTCGCDCAAPAALEEETTGRVNMASDTEKEESRG